MNHTPEPWTAHQADSFGSFKITPAEIWLGACSSMAKGEQRANAARIVECVNACAGIESPGEAIREAREALDTLTLVIGLTPLKGNLEAVQESVDSARKALAKLKGERPWKQPTPNYQTSSTQ